jgi:hypothetical protein
VGQLRILPRPETLPPIDPEEGRRIVKRMDEIEQRLEMLDHLRDLRWARESKKLLKDDEATP